MIMNKETKQLSLSFKNFNELLEFYDRALNKPFQKATGLLMSMSSKGQMSSGADNSVSITYFFRNDSKFTKFMDAYLDFTTKPKECLIQKRKTYVEMVLNPNKQTTS